MAEWLRRHAWLKRHHAAHRAFNGKDCWRCEAAQLVREYDTKQHSGPIVLSAIDFVDMKKGKVRK